MILLYLRRALMTLAVFVGGPALIAQTLNLSVDNSAPTPGQAFNVTVSYVDSNPSAAVTALQFNLNTPAGISAPIWTLGAAGVAAGKSLQCNGTLCAASGLNTTVIQSGVIGTAVFQFPANQSSGTVPFTISGAIGQTLGTNALANLVVFTAGQPITVTVPGNTPGVTTLLAGTVTDKACTGAAAPYPSATLPDAKLPQAYPTLCYGASVHYRIPLPPGLYAGSLVFVEPTKTGPGQRILTATINGQQSNTFDLFTEAGGADTVLTWPFIVLDSVGVVDVVVTGQPVITGGKIVWSTAVLSAIIINAPITAIAGNAALAGITVAVAVPH